MYKCRIIKIFFIFVFCFDNVLLQRHCYTPDQFAGTCIELSKCEPLSSLRKKTPYTHEDRMFLSLSVCGFVRSNPLVCCSEESNYPQKSLLKPQEINLEPATKSSNVLPEPAECASALEERIFGGMETKVDEFPFSALLLYTNLNTNSTDYEYNCGGSLISHRHVVTAAHCVSPRILLPRLWELKKVRLGEHNLMTLLDCGEGVTEEYICAPAAIDIDIEQQITHDDFNANRHNDIALLKLSKDVQYSKFIRPICLPHGLMLNTDKINFIVTGFGRTESGESSNVKLKTNVGGVNNDECQTTVMTQTRRPIVNTQLCALGIDGKDSCNGDSGNGLIYMNTQSSHVHWVLMGIVSFGSNPCSSDIPGVYTRVSEYTSWIMSKL
ncbi:hypothetical protein PVAND_001300 [Polypedilum vanderplanki]|uniref:CLIP domain-containing serine protease n=1 Tax=Polypedilum vanderplanki TaxID=319348 RepID=A0A9J6BNU7_POLVA|nr:hypothetical protein PVAND_001300 [Polypedilum vanderplanki]